MSSSAQATPNLIGVYLESKAKLHQLVSYGDVVSHFDLPCLEGAWAAHPLSSIFDVIDQEDATANRPFRTAIVVGLGTNLPSDSFFESLEQLKGVSDPKTPSARLTLWISEFTNAHKYPWPE